MTMPAEDAYWHIGNDLTRYWSSARRTWVAPNDAGLLAWVASGRVPILELTVGELNKTLAHLGLAALSPGGDASLNYKAMIRRRANALADSGDKIGALLLLKSIGE